MLMFEEDSIYEVRADFDLSCYDREFLARCYLPFLGGNAFALYEYMLSCDKGQYYFVDDLCKRIGILSSSLISERQKLEACGLLSTYRNETKDKISYIFILFAPLYPNKFFNNILLSSLLISKIGKREFDKLINKYTSNSKMDSAFKNVTMRFNDVYDVEPDMNYYETMNGESRVLFDKHENEIKSDFSEKKLVDELSNIDVDVNSISTYLPDIKQVSVLYNVKEKTCANLIKSSLNTNNVFNFEAFKENASLATKYGVKDIDNSFVDIDETFNIGNSMLAKKIKLLESISPKELLSHSLNDVVLPKSYLDLIYNLQNDYKINNGVLNVAIDYTLQKCNFQLPEMYIRKVIISLVKNNINTSSDAMTYLVQQSNKVINKKKRSKLNKVEAIVENKNEVKNDNNDDDFDLESVLGGVFSGK